MPPKPPIRRIPSPHIVFIPREQVRKRLFPLLLGRLRRLGGGYALAAQQLVAGHAVQFGDRGQKGYVGRGCARLPAAHRLIGNAEPVGGVLLRHSLGFRKIARNSPIVVFAIVFSFCGRAAAMCGGTNAAVRRLYGCGGRPACVLAARIAARRFSVCPFFASILSDSENFCNPRGRKTAPRTLEFLSNAGRAVKFCSNLDTSPRR